MTIEDAIPENTLTEEAKNELNKIKEIENKVDRENVYYRKNKCGYNFHNFRIISTFGRDLYNDTITRKEVDNDQNDLLLDILDFKKYETPKNLEKKATKTRCS